MKDTAAGGIRATQGTFSSFRGKNLTFFLIFAQNIDCGYTLGPVLTSTHNLCFRAKIRKMNTSINPSFTI